LLEAFLERPDEIMTREQLLELTVGSDTDVFDRCIDSQVRRLRCKIERNPARPDIIRTHWRIGYRFAAEVCWEKRDATPSRNM
jgi:two-component system OmpR family response regulator